MSLPEEAPDRAGEYLEAVLSLDPATDAAEILRRRREFLGKPALAGRDAGPAPGEEAEARARQDLQELRERSEVRARAKAVSQARRTPALRTGLSARLRRSTPGAKSAGVGVGFLIIYLVLRLIVLLSKGF